jgi:hypothetical protein
MAKQKNKYGSFDGEPKWYMMRRIQTTKQNILYKADV